MTKEDKKMNKAYDINFMYEILSLLKPDSRNIFFTPASEIQLYAQEKQLRVRLPASYRALLTGEKGTNGALLETMDLFGTEDSDAYPYRTSIVGARESLGTVSQSLVPFACFGTKYFFFDVSNVDKQREYPVVTLEEDGQITRVADSFPQWLQEFVMDEQG